MKWTSFGKFDVWIPLFVSLASLAYQSTVDKTEEAMAVRVNFILKPPYL